MKTDLQELKPLPIKFDKESHRYIWEPTGEVFTHSVTGITGFDMDEKKKIAIERTKKYRPLVEEGQRMNREFREMKQRRREKKAKEIRERRTPEYYRQTLPQRLRTEEE